MAFRRAASMQTILKSFSAGLNRSRLHLLQRLRRVLFQAVARSNPFFCFNPLFRTPPFTADFRMDVDGDRTISFQGRLFLLLRPYCNRSSTHAPRRVCRGHESNVRMNSGRFPKHSSNSPAGGENLNDSSIGVIASRYDTRRVVSLTTRCCPDHASSSAAPLARRPHAQRCNPLFIMKHARHGSNPKRYKPS
jgi:hypothetical protein